MPYRMLYLVALFSPGVIFHCLMLLRLNESQQQYLVRERLSL